LLVALGAAAAAASNTNHHGCARQQPRTATDVAHEGYTVHGCRQLPLESTPVVRARCLVGGT